MNRTWSGPPASRAASATRVVAGEGWTKYNRISAWVYPTLPGFKVISLMLHLQNEGPERGGRNTQYVPLRNNSWNHVVWEIPDLARDKVNGLAFAYRLQGNEPGATDRVTFDIDQLKLQRVDADHHEGWNVAPGRISFSHTGYQSGSPKAAIASDLDAREFSLIRQETGETVLTNPVQTVTTPIGRFQVMDFTDVTDAGTYFVRVGAASTRSFRIGHNVRDDSIRKAINYFYVQPCGTEIPGVHGVCHPDWQVRHGDKTMTINGGWHDEGDLSQGLPRTAEAVYAMFCLAERLRASGEQPALCHRLIEEAKWDLDFVLRVNFRDGYRLNWATIGFWTNGIIVDADDIVVEPMNRYDQIIAERRDQQARLVGLKEEAHYEPLAAVGYNVHLVPIRLAARLLDPDAFILCAAILKTHNTVVATMAVKNMVMGAPLRSRRGETPRWSDKRKFHVSPNHDHYNMLLTARRLAPHWGAAVIDGFEGMEGNGPVSGTPVPSRIGIASTDYVAADRVALEAMGIEPEWVGYLRYCEQVGLGNYDMSKIDVRGETIASVRRPYLVHSQIDRQLKWMGRLPDAPERRRTY